jgi:hypothetical protein
MTGMVKQSLVRVSDLLPPLSDEPEDVDGA